VPIFVERFLLPLFAGALVALAVTNPMGFDKTQRTTGVLALFFAAYFAAHTIYVSSHKPVESRAELPKAQQETPHTNVPSAAASVGTRITPDKNSRLETSQSQSSHQQIHGEKATRAATSPPKQEPISIQQSSSGPNSPNIVAGTVVFGTAPQVARGFTKQQYETFVGVLKRKPSAIQIVIIGNSKEIQQFASVVIKAFTDAGWTVDTSMIGMSIQVFDTSNGIGCASSPTGAAEIVQIQTAFAAVGMSCKDSPDNYIRPSPVRSGATSVLVIKKPSDD
jgi:hypothetical protein